MMRFIVPYIANFATYIFYLNVIIGSVIGCSALCSSQFIFCNFYQPVSSDHQVHCSIYCKIYNLYSLFIYCHWHHGLLICSKFQQIHVLYFSICLLVVITKGFVSDLQNSANLTFLYFTWCHWKSFGNVAVFIIFQNICCYRSLTINIEASILFICQINLFNVNIYCTSCDRGHIQHFINGMIYNIERLGSITLLSLLSQKYNVRLFHVCRSSIS